MTVQTLIGILQRDYQPDQEVYAEQLHGVLSYPLPVTSVMPDSYGCPVFEVEEE